ncbi:hypothetical protein BX265_2555 [Streptomyces sp. TLI_235]|nr:hypothetical protein [Streptomyces sp. TLI_235]PBC77798.1 hypothetical protein BX265_2555 [Streptomyces sp. TLI_235]
MTGHGQLPNVTDERLCWLAVREELRKKAHKVGLFGWITALVAGAVGGRSGTAARTAAGTAGDMRRDEASGRMADYAFAVDDAAGTLGADERRHLRATGEVPAWFLADVERRVAEIRAAK